MIFINPIELSAGQDNPELLVLWEESVRATHDFLSEEDIRQIRPCVVDALSAVSVYTIRDQSGALTAFIGLSEQMVEMLFVRPDCRGGGLGRRLMEFAIAGRGIRKVDVNEQNGQARRFYERLGFRVASRDALDPMGRPFPILHLELNSPLL